MSGKRSKLIRRQAIRDLDTLSDEQIKLYSSIDNTSAGGTTVR